MDLTLPLSNPVQVFALVMLVILLVPLLLARLRLPGLVGLILAGVVLGPHALGILERGPTMQLLGTVGLLYIMFTAGLEFDLDEFDRHRGRSAAFGILTFAVPQVVGTTLASVVLGFSPMAAVLLGSVFASHTLLAYPVVSRLGIARSEVVTTAVGATILTDTAALLVLAVVAGAAEEGLDPAFVIQLLVLLGVFVVGVLWALPRLGRWFYRRLRADGTAAFTFVLAAVFLCAVLAEFVGVEAIIGAFLAGLGLNRLVPEQSALMNRIQFVGEALFIPFFLLATGMLVDLGALAADPRAWGVALLMVATVIATKGVAAWVIGRAYGYDADERRVLFALTVPQAAATLAAVLVGYRVGLFGTEVMNGTVLMILATCLLGPWMADRYGRRVALRDAARPVDPSAGPQRIMVPLANPATIEHILDVALLVRQGRLQEPLYPITIAGEGPHAREEVAGAERVLAAAGRYAAAAEVPIQPLTRVSLSVAEGLRRAIREHRITTVVMGWNDVSAAERFIFGSISDGLLNEPHVLLLLCRVDHPLEVCERVMLLVPPLAHREAGFGAALNHIRTLCRQVGASLCLLAEARQLPGLHAATRALNIDASGGEVSIERWDDALAALATEARPDDLLILLGARRGTLSWQHSLDRLPRTLGADFPQNNLMVLYPPAGGEEGAWL